MLITGAAGVIGGYLRQRLPALGYDLRLLDVRDVPGEHEGIVCDVRNLEAVRAAVSGMDAVVHLAGINDEAPFEEVLDVNVRGTFHVFQAARDEGVGRVVFASSNHVQGLAPRAPIFSVEAALRPDSYYALGKIMGETLGRLYSDRFGMRVACLRIGTCCDEPTRQRHLATWLSPGDVARLVDACLRAEDLSYAVVFGVSKNARAWWDPEPGEALGYYPQDDAEEFGEKVMAAARLSSEDPAETELLGGSFALTPLGQRTAAG